MSIIRETSRRVLQPLGVSFPAALPNLEAGLVPRDLQEAASRLLAMHCIAAVAHGFDRRSAQEWISREKLAGSLTASEKRFLSADTGESARLIWLVEAMWALAWALSKVSKLDVALPCDERFVLIVPNLRRLESSGAFRQTLSLRNFAEVVQACDTLYCLHWAMVDAGLRHQKLPVPVARSAVQMRRHALEWFLTRATWDEVPLDT